MITEVQTITTYLLILLTIILLYCIWYFQQIYKYWEKRRIPYLKPTLPFGNLLQVYIKKCQIGEAFANIYYELKKMGVKHGGGYALNSPVYIPIDPTIIKHIIANDAKHFINHGYYQDSETDPLSAHLFNLEGNQWKSVRSKITHAYTVAKLKKMFVTMVEGAKEFEEHLELCRIKNPEGINIKEETIKLTTDTMMRVSYGMETNTLKNDNQELLKELHNFLIDQWTLYKNTMIFAFPRNILKLLKFRLFTKESNDYVRKLFVGLQKYRREFHVHRDDLADILISLTDKKDNQTNTTVKDCMKPLTENEFLAQMWLFVGAGSESASSTISFALYELSNNPRCQTKLRDEIKNILEKYNNELSFEAIKEMKYLDYVIHETLRLYPVLPILFRLCGNDYKVPGTDFVMEKDTLVVIPNYGIQRDSEYYPQPTKFDPERFTPENKAKRPFVAYMPFGEGPRICPGKKYGLLQAKVGLLTVIKNYVVSLSDKTESTLQFAPWELALRKTGDIWVKLEKIN